MLFKAFLDNTNGWSHGYDLMGKTGLKSGTLYPQLIRMEQDGLLESEWHPPVPPARAPRHAYRLTSKGIAFAHAMIAERNSTVGQAAARPA